jgi:hypothetical protein
MVVSYVNGVAIAVLPNSTGLVSDGCQMLDAATTYKLKKLAKELGVLFMPNPLYRTPCYTTYVDQIAGVLAAAEIFPVAQADPSGTES